MGWGSVCFKTETLVKKKEGHFCARLTGKATLAHSSQKLRLGFLEVVTKGKSLMMRTNLLQTYSALTAIARHQGKAGRVPPVSFAPKAHVRMNIPAQLGFKSRRAVCVSFTKSGVLMIKPLTLNSNFLHV